MKNIIKDITDFIKDTVKQASAKGVVIGMSGGKDSFVVAKLCSLALGNKNVLGLIMPNGNMQDLQTAKDECGYLKIKYEILNIEKLVDEMMVLAKKGTSADVLNEVSVINIPPRLRTNLLYAASGTLGYLVANTSNLSEKMIGYTTKWGDNVGDFSPLGLLTKTEVCELGLALGLPEEWVNKTPDDGLSNKSDEEKIGFSYSELDEYIRNGTKQENFSKIEKMHLCSSHKRDGVKTFEPNLTNHFYK